MHHHGSIGVVAVLAALCATICGARALDAAQLPDWKGQWGRVGDARWDTSKPRLAQQAPLTAEYQAFLAASIAEQAAGGHGNDLMYKCYPPGMPRMMLAYNPIEFVMTADVTYVVLEHMNQRRRIYTDGRDWPETLTPSFVGYSLGKWIDEDHGRYHTLLIETRGMRGPRAFDSSGLPLHDDNETVVKERIYLDQANADLLHDEITTVDHALTRPWTVTRSYTRQQQPVWIEHVCSEDNHHVEIGNENYFVSFDGFLMPTRKNQAAPDLRDFDHPAR
ncbi:MAG TPA: hypothetical protein VGL31_06920 [Xanthobacteraceae bacterium]|jgi:hypothetical protein